MGKVSKAAKAVDVKKETQTKVKKLANSGVTKQSAKVNLKDARAPISKLLKNKPEAVKSVLKANVKSLKTNKNKPEAAKSILKENVKSLKTKKNVSQPTEIKVKPKTEQVEIMKTLKRKSNSENSVKLPIPKKTTGSATNVSNKKLKTKVSRFRVFFVFFSILREFTNQSIFRRSRRNPKRRKMSKKIHESRTRSQSRKPKLRPSTLIK